MDERRVEVLLEQPVEVGVPPVLRDVQAFGDAVKCRRRLRLEVQVDPGLQRSIRGELAPDCPWTVRGKDAPCFSTSCGRDRAVLAPRD